MKKILFVTDYYLPYISGITVYAKNLLEELSKRKYSVLVLTNKHKKDLLTQESIGKIEVLRAKPLFRLSRGFVSPGLFFDFIKMINKVDVCILNLPMPESFVFSPIAKLMGKKVILIYQANLNLPSWSIFSRLIESIVLINHIIAGFFADKIITSSKEYQLFAKYLKFFRYKQEIVTPPIKINKPNLIKSREWKSKLNLQKYFLIGFAGRFAEEKGGDILIEVASIINKKMKNFKIVFAGETNLSYENFFERNKDVIEKICDKIMFLGNVPFSDMPEFYAMIDVLAITSRADCFPAVEVEAMLCGCPVVIFDIPGGSVPVKMSKMGEIVPRYDREMFAQKILDILNNRKKYCQSREKIEEIFNYQKTLLSYEKLFTDR